MGARFHSLKRALKALRPIGAVAGTPTPDAPEGTVLRHFQDYKAGKIKVEYVRAAGSNPGNEASCSLTPFGVLGAEIKPYLTNISARALAGIAPTGVTEVLLGIDSTPAGNAGLEREKGFKPARVTISMVPAGAGTSTPSKLSGESYKKKATKTYTYPFGSTAAHLSYKSAKGNLIAVVSTGTANRGITFKPEVI